jgi:hypothetical protein
LQQADDRKRLPFALVFYSLPSSSPLTIHGFRGEQEGGGDIYTNYTILTKKSEIFGRRANVFSKALKKKSFKKNKISVNVTFSRDKIK